MGDRRSKEAELLALLGSRVVAYRREFVEPTGGVAAALVLSQALWLQKVAGPEAWWRRSWAGWNEDLGLGRKAFNHARDQLLERGFLEEDRDNGHPPRYRLRLVNLARALREGRDNAPPYRNGEGNPSPFGEGPCAQSQPSHGVPSPKKEKREREEKAASSTGACTSTPDPGPDVGHAQEAAAPCSPSEEDLDRFVAIRRRETEEKGGTIERPDAWEASMRRVGRESPREVQDTLEREIARQRAGDQARRRAERLAREKEAREQANAAAEADAREARFAVDALPDEVRAALEAEAERACGGVSHRFRAHESRFRLEDLALAWAAEGAA